jgi:hypothetical protein
MPGRIVVLLAIVAAACAAPPPPAAPTQKTYASPDEAARALIDVVKKSDLDGLIAMLGPDGKELAETADPATGRRHREVFTVAAAEGWHLEEMGADKRSLVIGNENWPFPIPIVKDGNTWRFDTAAGKEEVIARRIGRNELAVIQACRTYVFAQQLYAKQGHDGNPPGLYARSFRSDPGKQNGLYWPSKPKTGRSPLGDLFADAEPETRAAAAATAKPMPFHGYYFKIITAQGASAPGGAKDYVVKDRMSGGFALVAWPAAYDESGVMSFIVNQDGAVHERDLGADTAKTAQAMTSYDPDSSWKVVVP